MSQTLVHGAVSMLIIEAALRIWTPDSPRAAFRYRAAGVVLTAMMAPVFQCVLPSRGAFLFRVDHALFDSALWLDLHVAGAFRPGFLSFLAVIAFTTAVVGWQELRPLFGGAAGAMDDVTDSDADTAAVTRRLEEAADILGQPAPRLRILDIDEPLVLTRGILRHTVEISRGLLDRLDPPGLRAALAHEMAHVARRSNLVTLLLYGIRLPLFFNPFLLFAFRRLVQDDELICDEVTCRHTGEPDALAGVLRTFLDPPERARTAEGFRDRIEVHGHRLRLLERIERIEAAPRGRGAAAGFSWSRFLLVVATIVVLCFHIV